MGGSASTLGGCGTCLANDRTFFAFVFVAACGDSQNPDPASPEGSGTGYLAIDGSVELRSSARPRAWAVHSRRVERVVPRGEHREHRAKVAPRRVEHRTTPAAVRAPAALCSAPPVQGTPGVWENVTPAGLGLSFDGPNGGVVHHVLVDAARPSDIYALTSGGQGVWKSTDFGGAWTRVDTKTPLTGSQRASAIDSNKLRDPSTPPTLWTVNAGGGDHLWKSTDGGVSWRLLSYRPLPRMHRTIAIRIRLRRIPTMADLLRETRPV